jgi:hypothetical protein
MNEDRVDEIRQIAGVGDPAAVGRPTRLERRAKLRTVTLPARPQVTPELLHVLRAQYGLYFAWKTLPVVTAGTYHICVLLWVVTLLLPEYSSRRTSPAPVQELQHWNDALERVLHQ